MTEVLDYEALVRAFETALVTKLRGHGAEAEYLEMWVPDEDPVKSILNMVEAAEAYGREGISIRVGPKTLSDEQINALLGFLGDIGVAEVMPKGSDRLIEVKGLQG